MIIGEASCARTRIETRFGPSDCCRRGIVTVSKEIRPTVNDIIPIALSVAVCKISTIVARQIQIVSVWYTAGWNDLAWWSKRFKEEPDDAAHIRLDCADCRQAGAFSIYQVVVGDCIRIWACFVASLNIRCGCRGRKVCAEVFRAALDNVVLIQKSVCKGIISRIITNTIDGSCINSSIARRGVWEARSHDTNEDED
jgi:hypothetical protein